MKGSGGAGKEVGAPDDLGGQLSPRAEDLALVSRRHGGGRRGERRGEGVGDRGWRRQRVGHGCGGCWRHGRCWKVTADCHSRRGESEHPQTTSNRALHSLSHAQTSCLNGRPQLPLFFRRHTAPPPRHRAMPCMSPLFNPVVVAWLDCRFSLAGKRLLALAAALHRLSGF